MNAAESVLGFRTEFVCLLFSLSYPTYHSLCWATRNALNPLAQQSEFKKYLFEQVPFGEQPDGFWEAKSGNLILRISQIWLRPARAYLRIRLYTDDEWLRVVTWLAQDNDVCTFTTGYPDYHPLPREVYFDKVHEAIEIFKNALNQ